jgi:hypothetical protein
MQHFRDRDGRTIIDALVERRRYDPDFARRLLDHAVDRGADWPSRRVAVLALENQLLSLAGSALPADQDPAAIHEAAPLLVRLGFAPAAGAPCCDDVLKQGYTTTATGGFFGELIRRLSRLAPVHRALMDTAAAPEAAARFLDVASQECLLTLARGAFGADEVVAEILRRVRVTAAEIDTSEESTQCAEEARTVIDLLPEYEADILARLHGVTRSWWFSAATPMTHNALIAWPVGTSALVIRPPGSSVEFEIKRVGMRGRHALTILYERGGKPLPPSHRLQGAATLSVLQWEAKNCALLSTLYRMIHREAPPLSAVVQLRKVTGVPRTDGTEVPLLDWFDRPEAFGDGFDPMRQALTRSLFAFALERYVINSVPRMHEARTRAFLRAMTPAQCTLTGTSALRLDVAAAWLGSGGAHSYFVAVYGRAPTLLEACLFADTVLMEILDSYRPPAPTTCYAAYVAAAFAENRAAADRAFLAALTTLGRLWGTLLGLRGYTEGESFVPRNVGLRVVWADGQWTVRIIFMDHELTNVIGKSMRHFHPEAALSGMHKDWVHIVGGRLGGLSRAGAVAALVAIYRPDAALAALGRARMIEELRRAYRITLARMRDDPALRARFRDSFVSAFSAWDAVLRLYHASRVGARERARWKGAMRRVMAAHGLDEKLIGEYRRAIHRHRRMLRGAPYLFDADGGP